MTHLLSALLVEGQSKFSPNWFEVIHLGSRNFSAIDLKMKGLRSQPSSKAAFTLELILLFQPMGIRVPLAAKGSIRPSSMTRWAFLLLALRGC
ncbi:hypothetical protein GALL_518630 [mine drainage metagenome]|uniref:Uncharacterized protein n=1 Tax=mine drainage metagenome TaxID=410659 RepID=A0A1J5PSM1_9ZZZZ